MAQMDGAQGICHAVCRGLCLWGSACSQGPFLGLRGMILIWRRGRHRLG